MDREIVDRYLDRYSGDLVSWCRDFLGVHLWSKQREVISKLLRDRFVCVPSGHAVGKTFLAACLTLAFLFTRRNSKVITTAPTQRQVRKLLWEEIHRLSSHENFRQLCKIFGVDLSKSLLTVEFRVRPGWYAVGVSSNDPQNLQGIHGESVLLIFDEAGGIDDPLVWESMRSLAAGGEGYGLAIGNPLVPEGPFYEYSKRWSTIRISCLDTPAFTKEPVPDRVLNSLATRSYVEAMLRDYGEDHPYYQSRVLGIFPESSVDSYVTLLDVERAQSRSPESGPVYMGLDVARYGSDSSVLVGIMGNRVEVLGVWGKLDTMDLVGRVVRLLDRYHPEVVGVDVVGVGAGVYDRLREMRYPVVEYQASASGRLYPGVPEFLNVRAESWWLLSRFIREEAYIPEVGVHQRRLISDVLAVRYEYDSRGRMKAESKDEVRRRLGRSPDYGDALAIAVYFRDRGRGYVSIRDYSEEAVVELDGYEGYEF